MNRTLRPSGRFSSHLSGTFWAAVGAAATLTLLFAVALIVRSDTSFSSIAFYEIGNILIFSGYAFVLSFGVFLIAVFLLGLPVSWLLERTGLNKTSAAILAGGMTSAAAATPIFGLSGQSALPEIGMAFAAGCVAGLLYFRARRS